MYQKLSFLTNILQMADDIIAEGNELGETGLL